jgi:hypothetical protein
MRLTYMLLDITSNFYIFLSIKAITYKLLIYYKGLLMFKRILSVLIFFSFIFGSFSYIQADGIIKKAAGIGLVIQGVKVGKNGLKELTKYGQKIAAEQANLAEQQTQENIQSSDTTSNEQSTSASSSSASSNKNDNRSNQNGDIDEQTAEKIADGHAFDKHVIQGKEYKDLGISTRKQFASHIKNIINKPTSVRHLSGGRTAYYDESTNTVIIVNPKAIDGGTAFRPVNGRVYFDNLR